MPVTAVIDHPGRVLGGLLAMILVAGCAPGNTSVSLIADGPGVTLSMEIEGAGALAVRYEVDPDGTLRFSGGRDMILGRVTWTGRLTREESIELAALVDTDRWGGSGSRRGDADASRRYRIRLASAGRRSRFELVGADETTVAVEALLERATRRRFEAFLETLPVPSLDAYIEEQRGQEDDRAEAAVGEVPTP